FTWNPSFIDNKEKDYTSEEESDFVPINNDPNNHINEEVFGDVYSSDDDGVSETVFGSNTSSPNQVDGGKENSKSEDPFEGVVHHEMLGTFNGEADNNGGKDNSVPVSARVMNTSQDIPEEMHSDSVGSKTVHNGGSMLGVMEDFIRIGQAIVYAMEGSVNDLATIIWNSGGILCISEASILKKDYVTISDNFIAIHGTWLRCSSKILFIVVYAPQQATYKRCLWDYISTIIGRWNGESIVMGDFNEV
nr:RNA-directed DNA polymerase, eukaryota [Tanacetum cinerariifolium]